MNKTSNIKAKQQKKNRKVMMVQYGVKSEILKEMEKLGCNTTYHTIEKALAGYCNTYEQCLARKLAIDSKKYIYPDDIE